MKKNLVLYALATAAATFFLSACGGSAGGEASSAAGPEPDGAGSSDELYVYNWGEYIDEEVITRFEEETGIRVPSPMMSSVRQII